MSAATLIYLACAFAALVLGAWYYGQGQAVRLRLAEGVRPHSRAPYHGALCAVSAALAGGAAWLATLALRAGPVWQASGFGVATAAGALAAGRFAGPDFRARLAAEGLARGAMLAAASLSVLVSLGIVLTLLVEALLFFGDVSVLEFVFGTQWSPLSAMRDGDGAAAGAYGSLPVLAGTFLIALVAVAVAGPVGVMIAVYLSEYASPRVRGLLGGVVEVLAGIPPVVYGLFAILAMGPALRDAGQMVGLAIPVQSALSAGLVMAIMILPLVSALSADAMRAVPRTLRDASTAMGATPSETVRAVVLPSAAPGILAGVLLATSRAVGETMIVLLAAGRAAPLSANPLDSVTTVTVQIVALLTGEPVFDNAKTRAAFALGLLLFVLTLALNTLALAGLRRLKGRQA